jgi:hypothetical protein
VSGFHTGRYYYDAAQKDAAQKFRLFRSFFARKLKERFLWPIVFGVIALIGLGLLVTSIFSDCGRTTTEPSSTILTVANKDFLSFREELF